MDAPTSRAVYPRSRHPVLMTGAGYSGAATPPRATALGHLNKPRDADAIEELEPHASYPERRTVDDAGKIETEWRAMPKIWAFPGLDELARKRTSRCRARDVWELARLWAGLWAT